MRLLLNLVVAAGLSLLIGLAASQIASLMPCRGEGLVCNLDEAIGAYAVLIWSCLGPLIFGVVLAVASNRVTLAGGTVILLAPLLVFMFGSFIESWTTIGFEPYRNLRAALTMFLPPVLVVVAQWLILGALLGQTKRRPAGKETKAQTAQPEPPHEDGGFTPFLTE
ncbi:MAG TPA: hypothetical protein VLD66_01790 [Methyloceanibacter sp.]|nr:hypothetical protein [Methyloceanibacter sp.]